MLCFSCQEVALTFFVTENNIKLYVLRVFKMATCDELIPKWLNFVEGVFDSEDFSPDISCETVHQNRTLRVIKQNIDKNSFNMSATSSAKNDYKRFYEQFGKELLGGIHEDSTNRTKIADMLTCCGCDTSKSESGKSIRPLVRKSQALPWGVKWY